jgi:hypothetical protein
MRSRPIPITYFYTKWYTFWSKGRKPPTKRQFEASNFGREAPSLNSAIQNPQCPLWSVSVEKPIQYYMKLLQFLLHTIFWSLK